MNQTPEHKTLLNIEVETTTHRDGCIFSLTRMNGEVLSRQVADIRDAQVRAALNGMGWIEPGGQSARPAADGVSDAEIDRIVWEYTRLNPNQAADSGLMLCIRNAVRAILALRPAQQAVPMTEEQIVAIAATDCAIPGSYVYSLVRAVEAHHGITAQAKGGQ